MREKTYQRAIDSFRASGGYMSFYQLKEAGVTIRQIHELEEMGAVEKIARGWYWCRECGLEKPADYKYVEVGLVYPKAVFCLESAGWLNGLTEREPEVLTIATDRTDRMKLSFNFPFKRFYLQNAGLDGEILEKRTALGTYRYYSQERTICDTLRLRDKVTPEFLVEVEDIYSSRQNLEARVLYYAQALRAVRNVKKE